MSNNKFQCSCGAMVGQYHKFSCHDLRRDETDHFDPSHEVIHNPEYWRTCGPSLEECLGEPPDSRSDSGVIENA